MTAYIRASISQRRFLSANHFHRYARKMRHGLNLAAGIDGSVGLMIPESFLLRADNGIE
jgi:hypothetical protein